MNAALILLVLLVINLLTFSMFWWDKEAARSGRWRIRERTLLWLALAGGSLGAVTAQRFFRHKTRKEPFRSVLLLIVACQAALAGIWILAPTAILEALQWLGVDDAFRIF